MEENHISMVEIEAKLSCAKVPHVQRETVTVLINAAVLFPGRTRGIDAPWRFNCSLTSSGSSCRNV